MIIASILTFIAVCILLYVLDKEKKENLLYHASYHWGLDTPITRLFWKHTWLLIIGVLLLFTALIYLIKTA